MTDARGGGMGAMGLSVYLPTVVFGTGHGAIQPVIALSALALGASPALAGLIVAIAGIGRVLGDLPAGWLADRLGERTAMLISLGIYTAGTATCALAPSPCSTSSAAAGGS